MSSSQRVLLISSSNVFNKSHFLFLSRILFWLVTKILRSRNSLFTPPSYFLKSLVFAHNLSKAFVDYANDPSNAERIQKSLTERLNSDLLFSAVPSKLMKPFPSYFFSALNLIELKSKGFNLLQYLFDLPSFLVSHSN